MDSIRIDNLTFAYDNKHIFNDLSAKFPQGGFCSILGPNGSGKTTLLKCIVGLLQPSGGTITLDGRPMAEYKKMDLARKIAYVPQYQDIVFDITVYDYVLLGRNPYQTPWEMQSAGDKEVVEEMLERCKVWKYRDSMLQALSGGERQRVMVARAMAQRTGIMLLDEPLSNIDVTHKFEIMDILQELNEGQNVTVLIILHDLPIAKAYSKEILLLKEGKMLHFGDKSAVLTEENIRSCFDLTERYAVSEEGFITKKL
ncbi:MAG: ABC transporter ATP-binding protein [Bacteroidales bacterium]|nr:ABC transporter ATP-binding protein [Bacteroidales bacterium]